MEKITKKQTVKKDVEQDVILYKTRDGKEYKIEENAIEHEKLLDKYPKLCENDFNLVYNFICENWGEQILDEFNEAFKSDKVILLTSADGCNPGFEVVDLNIVAVEAVVKALNGRSLGMNCDLNVDAIIYKGESVCCKYIDKYDNSVHAGRGRELKDVLGK